MRNEIVGWYANLMPRAAESSWLYDLRTSLGFCMYVGYISFEFGLIVSSSRPAPAAPLR